MRARSSTIRDFRRRLLPGGLRWRLTAWVAVVMLLFAAVIFVAVYRGTGSQLRRQIDRELASDSGEFSHYLALLGSNSPRAVASAAARYVHGQPFHSSSTLLFAIVPGAGTSTNQPELFGSAAPDNGETPAEQAGENSAATRLRAASSGYSVLGLPDVGDVRLLERRMTVGPDRRLRLTIGVGEPLATVSQAQDSVARAFILAGALALAAVLLASYLVGVRVSRPLRRMAATAARVDAGELAPRMHDTGSPGDEVRVLADAFNHMLDRLADAFAGQRAFVADASHELRTPLTVIQGQLEVLAAQQSPAIGEVRRVERLVRAEISRITRLIDELLLLAKSEQDQFLRPQPIDLCSYVQDLWDGISLTAERHFELGDVAAGTLYADPDRVAQALRNLIRNAIEHTTVNDGVVRMRVERTGNDGVRFTVEDDGPGIPADQHERVFERFHRTDAARDRASGGTGLGLAIVRAIAQAHQGRVEVDPRSAHGTKIDLELPGFIPAGEARS